MKTPNLLGAVEHKASRQLTLLLGGARKQFNRFMHTPEMISDKAAQRRYIHAAEQTIISAEKIIEQLKSRVSAAKKSLAAGDGKHAARRVARRVPKRTGKKRIKPVKAGARRAAVRASSRAQAARKAARKAS